MILMMFGLKSVSKTDAKTDKNSELKTDYKDRTCHVDIGGFDHDYNKITTMPEFRFNQMMREIEGISPRILAKQLKEMESDGIIARKSYPEIPPRVEYSITEKGLSLGPILKAMADWGLKNMFSNRVTFDSDMITE